MFIRSTRWSLILSALFILAMGACGSAGGCGACSAMQPLPGGKLPADQTVEGGAQIRVTPHGFSAITSLLPGLIGDQFSSGFCVPEGSFGDPSGTLGTGANYCSGHPTSSCSPGCNVSVALNAGGLTTQITDQQTLNLQLSATASTSLHIDGQIVGIGFSCTLGVTSNAVTADLDVALGIDPATGELTVHLARLNSVHLPLDFSGCSFVSSIANLAEAILGSFVDQFVAGLLEPAIDGVIQSIVPRPLGLVGTMNLSSTLGGLGLAPGTTAMLETRLTPGGYVHMNAGGVSLGVITGLNADRDPSTRTPALESEPALCVPPLAKPDLGAAPTNLVTTPRQTFQLDTANDFNGVPDPGGSTDVALGISKTTLELAGYHLVTSGAVCLGVGPSFSPQLSVETIGFLVPSLGRVESGMGIDPLLLMTRPQRALHFTIGENTVASPAITIGIEHLEVDFYAFVFERYVRAFTLDLTMNVGVNLEFEQPPGMAAKIRPTLVGISPKDVQLTVLNSEFVSESPDQLAAVLPSVFSLVTPLLGNLPEIAVPSFAGFELDQLSIRHVKTAQDDFLAIYASLGTSALLRAAATGNPLLARAVTAMDSAAPPPAPVSTGRARLASVTTPTPERIRGALMHDPDGAMPTVVFDVDSHDAAGRALEWSYQLDHGMWRTWSSQLPLVIEDQAFAWQGKYTIGLKSRAAGDYHTVSEAGQFPVIIDSVAPRIAVDKAAWNADHFEIPAFDVVSRTQLSYAFGKPGSATPESAWVAGATIAMSRDDAAAYAGADGKVAVFVKDEAGNTATALVAPNGEPASAGCAATRDGPGAGSVVLVVLVAGLMIMGRRGRRERHGQRRGAIVADPARWRAVRRVALTGALWAGGSIAMSLQPGCSCSKAAAQPQACEMDTDCSASACTKGELPFCVDNVCVCSDDIPPGRIGPYSDVAVGPDGQIWVSAYAQTHGDLVVAKTTGGRIPDDAWEWVDGVPAGPVVIPGAKIRGGIADDGPDVGMYTSIAVAPDGTPMVSYFDRGTASLKLAQRINGTWQTHVVDPGMGTGATTGTLGDSGALVGMYTSLTLRSDDGRPGIAYLAHVKDAKGARAEVRFVSAQTPHPASSGDWQAWVVDTAALPPDDPANPSLYPLPAGLGLFIDSARMPNQAPVVAYYDRGSGDLKLAKFNVQAGQFAAAKVLDGSNGIDAGWTPSVAVDAKGVVNVAYVGTTGDDLKFVTDAAGAVPEVVDDGYRIVGQTVDGLPKPEFHFVGDNAGLLLPPGGGAPFVVYQDATTQELLLAHKQPDGTWNHTSIAGATTPWPGGYGFFAAGAIANDQIVMSSWVVNLPALDDADDDWVEVFSRPIASP